MKQNKREIKIFKNLDIRIVSLILAAALWFYVSTEKYYKLTFHCPVEVRNIPEGFTLARCMPQLICEIEAKGRDLIVFQYRSPVVIVDVDNRQIKKLRVKLAAENMALPLNLKIRSVHFAESEIAVNLDRLAEKEVSVGIDIMGDPSDGFVLSDSIGAEPSRVILKGPAKQLELVDTVYSASVKIDGMSENAAINTMLALPDTCLYSAKPESVKVHLRFEKSGEKVFKNIPLSVINRSSNYLVSFAPGTIDLVISGPKNVLDAASASDLKIFLDLNGLQPGKHQLQATIELPEKLVLIAANPRDFEVNIR
jgi:YbbR domain-containing protein